MSFGRSCRAALLAAAVVTLLAGCNGLRAEADRTEPAAAVPETTKIRVGAVPIVDDVPLYIAKQRGYFAAEGLDVELVQSPTPPIRQLLNDSLDIAYIDYVSMFGAQATGAGRFRLLAEGYQATDGTMGIVTLERDIDEPLDLAGKRIAVNTEQEAGERVVAGVLTSNGVDPRRVTYKAMPFSRMGTALQRGEVDAAWMIEPFITEAGMRVGARLVLDAFRGPAANFPVGGYASTLDFAKRNPVTVDAFKRAINRAQREAGQRAVVEKILPTYTNVDPQTAVIISIGAYPTSTSPSPVRLQRVPNLMQRIGLLSSRLDARIVLE